MYEEETVTLTTQLDEDGFVWYVCTTPSGRSALFADPKKALDWKLEQEAWMGLGIAV